MKHYGSLEQKPEVSLELSNSEFDHEYPFGEREIFQQDGFWKEASLINFTVQCPMPLFCY